MTYNQTIVFVIALSATPVVITIGTSPFTEIQAQPNIVQPD